jgi:hypothetical protein
MKRSLVSGAFLLVLFIAGCYTNPPAAGPQGPSGATSQDRDRGHNGDRGRAGDRGHDGDQGRAGDQGREGRTGEQGRQGEAAPCPAGEHRFTDPSTGTVRCVRD